MKLPWKIRAEEEHHHRVAAEQRLADARADWPKVQKQAAELRREKELNGWTSTLRSIYGNPQHRRAQ